MGSKCFLDLYSVPRFRTRDLGMRAFAGLTAFFGVIATLTARLLTKKAVSTINRSAMKIVDQSFRRGSSNVRFWHKADIGTRSIKCPLLTKSGSLPDNFRQRVQWDTWSTSGLTLVLPTRSIAGNARTQSVDLALHQVRL